MYRTASKLHRPFRKYDFLTEVDPERLRLIGAVALAWNWLEATVDATLATSLGLHPAMWVEVQSRIGGFDGKIAIIKAALPTLEADMPDDIRLAIRKCLNATENYKSIRDHIIHVRPARPEEDVSETFQRRGNVKEVYTATTALKAYYDALVALVDEIEMVSTIYFYMAIMQREADEPKRQPWIKRMIPCGPQLLILQKKRESLPPLPEVPEPDPAQEAREAEELLQGLKD